MKKRTLSALVAGSLLLSGLTGMSSVVQAETKYNIIVEDKAIAFDQEPFLQKDRLMVPLRALAEGLGAEVTYDAATDTATIKKEDITLFLDFKTGLVTKNGEPVTMDPAPQVVNGRTMVPIRFISQAFGNNVDWNGSTNTVTVFPTESTMKMRQKIKEILLKSTEETNKQDSYQFDMNLSAEIPTNTLKVTVQGNALFDYTKNPFVLHGKGSMQGGTLLQQQTAEFEMYLMDGYVYFFEPTSKQWMKTQFMKPEQWDQFVKMSTGSNSELQAAQADLILPFATLKETSDSYMVNYNFNAAGIKKLMEKSAVQPPEQNPQALEAIKTMRMSVELDKSTYLQSKFSLEFQMNLPGMGAIKYVIDGNVKNYNKVQAIKLPEEAKNAVEMKLPTTPMPPM
ncbi:copper amine oxidase N-terminal domain-containing protein [Effusibacillus lacus]|uniref:Copper amine oxidase-like N-terminal domain-containing protein n=1 Tax=Effusibacillus lacus TaxID=1348429 RepID=A0A292YRS5_9BACL|nr:copper amine oxidase N-terminal domain-containing protein [Effusibacillus lacus]TCS76829.1 copper amine oxidase-like protein [Effusibacillus lacus]GAX91160.1 hypothetical protein EFBL_2826 [Effusibacillus lacus]